MRGQRGRGSGNVEQVELKRSQKGYPVSPSGLAGMGRGRDPSEDRVSLGCARLGFGFSQPCEQQQTGVGSELEGHAVNVTGSLL